MNGIKVEEVKKELKDLVTEKKSEMQKETEAKMSAEEKKALEEKQKKDQEAKDVKEAAKKADEVVLAKKDEERTAQEKERAKALLEEKQKAEDAKLSADEKIKRVQEASQKRIDEIVNELKQVKDKTSKEADDLKKEMQLLRAENEKLSKAIPEPAKDEIRALLEKKEKERIAKYLEDDKALSRESRREVSREDLEEWLLEDNVSANEWLVERSLRRSRERAGDFQEQRKSDLIRTITQKQEESNKRVLVKHPELDTAKREKELKEQGKSNEEIQIILCQENEKYRLATDIVRENPGLYLTKENGPELVAAEIEKRLAKGGSTEPTEEQKRIAELERKIEEQAAELESMKADVGIGSSVQRTKEAQEKLSKEEEQIAETMRSSGATQTMIDNAVKKHREKKEKR